MPQMQFSGTISPIFARIFKNKKNKNNRTVEFDAFSYAMK